MLYNHRIGVGSWCCSFRQERAISGPKSVGRVAGTVLTFFIIYVYYILQKTLTMLGGQLVKKHILCHESNQLFKAFLFNSISCIRYYQLLGNRWIFTFASSQSVKNYLLDHNNWILFYCLIRVKNNSGQFEPKHLSWETGIEACFRNNHLDYLLVDL